jgi:hypothetical protein
MTKHQNCSCLKTKKVRTVWDVEQEKWYFNCGCYDGFNKVLTRQRIGVN